MFPGGRAFRRFLLSALRTLNTPVSLGIHLLVENHEWDQLASVACDPRCYLDTPSGVHRYRLDAQATALVRKVPWPTTFSRRAAAESTFEACEARCAETNHFIEWLLSGLAPQDKFLTACRGVLDRAKKAARSILGPLPLDLEGRFGPGTVFEHRGSRPPVVADKVCITPTVTRSAEPIFRFCSERTFWSNERLRVGLPFIAYSEGNRFTTVPKDGKTDRGICVEPGGNIWCQLAVGDVMKERLKRVGLHVARSRAPSDPLQLVHRRLSGLRKETGQDIHRRLAEIASRDGHLATLDLRNASDTVARRLVEALLPDDWLQLLGSLRSPKTQYKKRWVYLEKFSSMGNGFTFELETLVFSCLIHGVTGLWPGVDFWVYGDDIILPSKDFSDVVACLTAFGFEPNKKKSFHTGFFRESCGGDFFLGYNVRPFFVTGFPVTPLDWQQLHNGWCRFLGRTDPLSKRICSDEVPAKFRVYGPPGSPGVFWTSDSTLWCVVTKRSIAWLSTVQVMPVRIPLDRWDSWCHYTLALLSCGSSGLTPPRSIAGFRLKKVSIS